MWLVNESRLWEENVPIKEKTLKSNDANYASVTVSLFALLFILFKSRIFPLKDKTNTAVQFYL